MPHIWTYRGAVLAVALTPRRLVTCLQRNLDVRVPMPRELMSSFGETNAALEGQRGHILVANHHEEGLLPRTANIILRLSQMPACLLWS